jgi:hypothetical protein
MATAVPSPCPVCSRQATVTDWRPTLDWFAVEGCGCGGFFVWVRLLEGRLAGLTLAEREDLTRRVQWLRGRGREAWLVTVDGTLHGELVVRDVRPDRPR